jgi:hypothetical protein
VQAALRLHELLGVDAPDLGEHTGALLVVLPQLDLELEGLDDARPVLAPPVQVAEAVHRRQARGRGLDRRVVVADGVVLLAELRLHDRAALEVEQRLDVAIGGDLDLPPGDVDEIRPLLGRLVNATERLERRLVGRRDGEQALVVLDGAVVVAQPLLADLRDAREQRHRLVAGRHHRDARAQDLDQLVPLAALLVVALERQ